MPTEYTIKKGATGAIITATLSDADGAVDLTTYVSVNLVVSQNGGTVVIDDACVIDPDQGTNPGVVSYSFDATSAAIAVGDYDLEFHAIDGSADLHIFPTGGSPPYGKLYVERSL